MKNFLLLLASTIFFYAASAQTLGTIPMRSVRNEVTFKQPKKQLTRSDSFPIQTYINYQTDDWLVDSFYNTFGGTANYIKNRPWQLNNYYTAADGQYIFNYVISRFDTFINFDLNFDTIVIYPKSNINSVTVNTIQVEAGWENNSGTNDTIKVSIIGLNKNGYPELSGPPIWDTLIYTDTVGSTVSNKWYYPTLINVSPNLALSDNNFAVRLDYYGSKLDTFIFTSGNVVHTCGSVTGARMSYFYPNSYGYWPFLGQFLPGANGNDYIFKDCGVDTADVINPIQDINIGVTVTLNLKYPLGISKTNPDITSSSLFPNPANSFTNLKFTMKNSSANSLINIYDLTGKLIDSYNPGNLSAGNHQQKINTSNFTSGMYIYSITTKSGTVYGKFVKE